MLKLKDFPGRFSTKALLTFIGVISVVFAFVGVFDRFEARCLIRVQPWNSLATSSAIEGSDHRVLLDTIARRIYSDSFLNALLSDGEMQKLPIVMTGQITTDRLRSRLKISRDIETEFIVIAIRGDKTSDRQWSAIATRIGEKISSDRGFEGRIHVIPGAWAAEIESGGQMSIGETIIHHETLGSETSKPSE